MHACLICECDVVAYLRPRPLNWLQRNYRALAQARKNYHAKHGVNPHPAVLLQLLDR